ncbi:MAG: TIGR02757 family protein [Flavobacteriales bacterium]
MKKYAGLSFTELQAFLDEKYAQFNVSAFIDDDPVSIPHRYSKLADIEIAAFLTATISWGNRKAIIKSASRMMELMQDTPHDFVMNCTARDLKSLHGFVHRTFNADDLVTFLKALRSLYQEHDSMEHFFSEAIAEHEKTSIAISLFKQRFFAIPHASRTEKHVSDPLTGSSAKRLNMFLRWMVRKDKNTVDLGLWKSVSTAHLSIPLDVHSGNVARQLGLLTRKQNDLRAVEELDAVLRRLDPTDPVKYDYALFGLGAIEKW